MICLLCRHKYAIVGKAEVVAVVMQGAYARAGLGTHSCPDGARNGGDLGHPLGRGIQPQCKVRSSHLGLFGGSAVCTLMAFIRGKSCGLSRCHAGGQATYPTYMTDELASV